MKLLIVIGTRPEAIKMGPVVRVLSQYPGRIAFKVCVTSQHRQLAEDALRLFGIVPDYDLNVMTEDQGLSRVAASVLERIDPILISEEPDWMLVQGDTTSVAAASVAAFYRRIRVGHVESGLRSHDRYRPFPEEVHRRMISIAADLHFAPTDRARRDLLEEGVPERDIEVTGNTVVDAVHWVASLSVDRIRLPIPRTLGLPGAAKVILVTAHRRESFGEPLRNICYALRDIANRYRETAVIVYPVHPNPSVHGPVHQILGASSNVVLTPPLDYATFIHLLRESYLVLTDSGGVQEEAPSFAKPVLILREVTERPENIEAGIARMVGSDRNAIIDSVRQLMDDPDDYSRMARSANPYGDGTAGKRIVRALLKRSTNPEPVVTMGTNLLERSL